MVKMLTQWDTCLKMAVCLVQLVYLLFIFMMVKHLKLYAVKRFLNIFKPRQCHNSITTYIIFI